MEKMAGVSEVESNQVEAVFDELIRWEDVLKDTCLASDFSQASLADDKKEEAANKLENSPSKPPPPAVG